MDTHTLAQRSYNMSQIKSNNTGVEINFRRYIWAHSVKGYRIKSKILGKPDLYFLKKRTAVFIDGCFWHKCPEDFVRPKSRNDYWDSKIGNNIKRDKRITGELRKKGIKVIRFWEHDVENNPEKCYLILRSAL